MEPLPRLVRLLDRALRDLGDAGGRERACRLAAQAWGALERTDPDLAERFTGTLHHLTGTHPALSFAERQPERWGKGPGEADARQGGRAGG